MAMTLIETNSDSTDIANIDFTSGIDSTYKLYIFKFINMNPSTDSDNLGVQFNVAGQSGFNETITSTYFNAYHTEDDGAAVLGYAGGGDQAQGTSLQLIDQNCGSAADENLCGTLWLFDPSNTTYVTNFYSEISTYGGDLNNYHVFMSGYVNATGAVDEVTFKFASGNNFDGTISMYGVK